MDQGLDELTASLAQSLNSGEVPCSFAIFPTTSNDEAPKFLMGMFDLSYDMCADIPIGFDGKNSDRSAEPLFSSYL